MIHWLIRPSRHQRSSYLKAAMIAILIAWPIRAAYAQSGIASGEAIQ